MLRQKIVRSFFKSPVLIITLGWTLSFSIGPLLGSMVGSAFDRLLFVGPDRVFDGGIIGLNLGLIVGAVACGYITAISLRPKIPEIRKRQMLAITLGWTGAIAVADSLMYLLSIALSD